MYFICGDKLFVFNPLNNTFIEQEPPNSSDVKFLDEKFLPLLSDNTLTGVINKLDIYEELGLERKHYALILADLISQYGRPNDVSNDKFKYIITISPILYLSGLFNDIDIDPELKSDVENHPAKYANIWFHNNIKKFNFIEYISEGNLQLAKYVLKSGSTYNYNYKRALTIACKKGYFDIVKYCVEELKVDINVKNNYPIRIASKNGYLEIVNYLLALDADFTVMNNYPVRLACANGHYDVVVSLIEYGAEFEDMENEALKTACTKGYLNIVEYLCDCGADVKVDNNYAIRWASKHGHFEIVKYLHHKGADITAQNNSSLMLAIRYGHYDIVNYIISKGYNVQVNNNQGIRLACIYNHPNIVKLLLNAGADITSKNYYGFLSACSKGHYDVIKTIIEHPVLLNKEIVSNALIRLRTNNHLNLVQYFIEHYEL